jgi:beta-lactamase superfamily II metal-dependent hydrolase
MALSVEFLPVGDSDGDAIVVRNGEDDGYYLHLIDAGYESVGEDVIKHIENYYGSDITIHNMVVSHADNDHAAGLIPVFKRFNVAALWMNRPWLYVDEVLHNFHQNWTRQGWVEEVRSKHEYLVELENLARARGMEPIETFQGAQIGPNLVLAPSRQRYIDLIPDLDKTPPPYRSDAASRSIVETARAVLEKLKETLQIETLDASPPATSASNETSIVQLCEYENHTILLTADAGPKALAEAANYAYSLGKLNVPDLVQIPHQGSRRNVTPAVLNAWLGSPNGSTPERGHAYVMVGAKKDEHPRKKVKNAFIRRGYPVFVGRTGWMRMNWGFAKRNDASPLTPESFSYNVEDD